MSQWKNTADTANAVEWVASSLSQGSGKTAIVANNTAIVANTTIGNIIDNNPTGTPQALGVGQFPVTSWAKANTTGEAAKVHGSGWALRCNFEGPITGLAAANGSGFSNGDTVTVTGGTTNSTVALTTNATGNLVSAVVTSAGLFPNTSAVSVSFTREKHVANLNFSNSTVLTGVGNSNTINVLISANSTDIIPNGVNAVGTFTSNSTGGITNSLTQAITWSAANSGTFSNAATNTAVIVTFTNANGTVVGGTFTATANLVTSTGGSVTVSSLGGRAGRVTYEMLAVMSPYSLSNGALANSTNSGLTPLPQ